MTDGTTLAPHRGAMILVLGILGLVMCFPLGIAAWVMGNTDLAAMDGGRMDQEGRSLTQAGKICGIVTVVLNGIALVIGLIALAVLVIAGAAAQH